MRKQSTNGQFQRQRTELWDGSNWNDGYVDNRGRFRVYRPDYPRAYALGYCLRAHIVWWLAHGKPHPKRLDIHHKDENKLNDRLPNLQLLGHGEHTRQHNLRLTSFICAYCQRDFEVGATKVSKRRREGKSPKYCSQSCYHAMPKTEQVKRAISERLKREYAEGTR